jgi:hypothetical protein
VTILVKPLYILISVTIEEDDKNYQRKFVTSFVDYTLPFWVSSIIFMFSLVNIAFFIKIEFLRFVPGPPEPSPTLIGVNFFKSSLKENPALIRYIIVVAVIVVSK